MNYNWNLEPFTAEERSLGTIFCRELRLAPVVGCLLARRGIASVEEAKRFFRPRLEDLHDPFLMKDMDKAVARLNRAVGRKEKIMIYGDYDVDGTTAVALVYKYLRATGCSETQLDYYIPDRYDEGYGISYRGIDLAHSLGTKLIIVLDCGIKAVEKVAYAKSFDIDFIICDHHNPDETLPDAVAVLDAKRADNTYPYEHLSGCGVGFKFMQAYARSNNLPESKLLPLLDLVAVSIASDIVPIMGENRILAYYGLRQLNKRPCLGLQAIIDVCGLKKRRIDMNDIVFKIGPRINASGRMMNGGKAVELLLSQDAVEAQSRTANIDEYNDQRRELDKDVTEQAIDILGELSDVDKKILVIYRPEWHKGVIGIVASRMTERYSRPTIVMTKSGDFISGSARSVGGFDVYKAIEHCKDLLVNFGGHPFASGLTIKEENLETFRKMITDYAEEAVSPELLVPQIDVDAEISIEEVNYKLLDNLKRMGPFGPENSKPVFISRQLYDAGGSRAVGKASEHLKIDVRVGSGERHPVSGIAFNQAGHCDEIKNGSFRLCYTIEENEFNGNKSLQLLVRDIKPEEESAINGKTR